MTAKKEGLKPAFRDGVWMHTRGEVFEAPGGEIVEVLYDDDGQKVFFVELQGAPACAHGDTVEDAILAAREKRGEKIELSDEEKQKYNAEDYKFSVSLFRRLTRACDRGTKAWLKNRGLNLDVKMTIKEFRKHGDGGWADELENALK